MMEKKKGVETNQVFLVPGQTLGVGRVVATEPDSSIQHFVVVANSSEDALALLEVRQPDFKPLGFTALSEFEKAVIQIRKTLDGKDTGWTLLVQPGVAD